MVPVFGVPAFYLYEIISENLKLGTHTYDDFFLVLTIYVFCYETISKINKEIFGNVFVQTVRKRFRKLLIRRY